MEIGTMNKNKMLKDKFNIIRNLEKWRWEQENQEYSFEYSFYCFKNDIDSNRKMKIIDKSLAEKILLTHYLLYICDRQMDYRHIFKAGGYVVSHLVEEYMLQIETKRHPDWNQIFKICRIQEKKDYYSYFLCAPIKIDCGIEIFDYFLSRDKIINAQGEIQKRISENEDTQSLESKSNNKKYNFLFKPSDDTYYAIFSSRYMLQDIGCMYKTLKYLYDENLKDKDEKNYKQCDEGKKLERLIKKENQKYNGSFFKFLRTYSDCICEYENDKKNKIKEETPGLARALFELTYQCVPKITAKDIDNDLTFDDVINSISKKFVSKLDSNKTAFSLENSRYSLKRMWCIIRDFLRHPVFSECFQLAVGEKNFKKLCDEQSKIELPGDVWNNNSTFARCFWNEYNQLINSSDYVRKKYNNPDIDFGECLPIDFDITFNFVPRMCEEDKCSICPFSDNNWQDKICHENSKGKLCPLSLYACGIMHICDDKCPLNK